MVYSTCFPQASPSEGDVEEDASQLNESTVSESDSQSADKLSVIGRCCSKCLSF